MKPIDLPVEVAQPSTGMAQAVLHELAGHLQQLIEAAKTEVIDITSLPMSSSDKQQLETLLGKGEVDITLNTIGESRIFETAYSGIWWIRHYTAEHKLISELIEICAVPQIIKTHPADMQQALARLQSLTNTEQ